MVSPQDAEVKSVALGGHLVVVNDAAEQDFLWSTFGPVTGLFWIGVNDVAREGRFIWTTAILLELGAISIAPGPKPTLTILRADVRPEAGYDSKVRVGFQFVA